MRIEINLSTRTYVNYRLVNLAIATAIALLLGLLVLTSLTISRNAGEEARVARETALLEARLRQAGKGFTDAEYKALLAKIAAANAIIGRKTVNWVGVLNAVESVIPDGMSVTSLQPSLKDQTLALTVVATDFMKLRSLFEKMEESGIFRNTTLLSQVPVQSSNDVKVPGYSFSLTTRIDFTKI